MSKHLKRSRVTKALTDGGLAASFDDAEGLDVASPTAPVGNQGSHPWKRPPGPLRPIAMR